MNPEIIRLVKESTNAPNFTSTVIGYIMLIGMSFLCIYSIRIILFLSQPLSEIARKEWLKNRKRAVDANR